MVLSGLGKCGGLGAFKVKVLHLGRHQETGGVDESVEARRWREELTMRVMRPKGAVGAVEDDTRPRVGLSEIEDMNSLYEFNAGTV